MVEQSEHTFIRFTVICGCGSRCLQTITVTKIFNKFNTDEKFEISQTLKYHLGVTRHSVSSCCWKMALKDLLYTCVLFRPVSVRNALVCK